MAGNWGYVGISISTAPNKLTVSGTYTIVASDVVGSDTGSYSLTLAKAPATQQFGADDGPILSGQTKNGTISAADFYAYPFSASAGDNVQIVMAEATDSSFRPRLYLY